jgi:hypothetical protein
MLTERLAEQLKATAERAEQLDPEAQERIADQLAAVLDNELWDLQLRSEHDLSVLRTLAEEARLGPKRPMPKPADTGDEALLDAEDLDLLSERGGAR